MRKTATFFLLPLLLATTALHAAEYQAPVELPPLLFGTTAGYDLSENGYIAGYSGDGTGRRAVRWQATATYLTGPLDLSPGVVGIAHGVNDNGSVVGESGWRAFLWRATTYPNLQILPPQGPSAYAIRAYDVNASDEVVGSYSPTAPGLHPFGAFRWTPFLPGSPYGTTVLYATMSNAFAINDAGTFVGVVQVQPGNLQGYVWRRTILPNETSIGELAPSVGSEADGINSHGHVVGTSGGDAVVWPYLPPAGLSPVGPGRGMDINDHGVIVGYWTQNTTQNAWVKKPALPAQDLNSLIPANSGWTLLEAHGINNNGWIVGVGRKTIPAPPGTPSSEEGEPTTTVLRGFLLRPQPAAPPSSEP